MPKPVVFVSYSHKDEEWKDRLDSHLGGLEKLGRLKVWDDRDIDAGAEWYDEIKAALKEADLAICLISPDFLKSDFIHKEEIPYLLQKREEEGLVLLPVLVRPCLWQPHDWLKAIQMLPRDGQSIAEDFAGKEDGAFTAVATRIFEIIDHPDYRRPAPPAPDWEPPEKVDLERLPVTGSELFGRRAELEMLDQAWEEDETNVVTLVAWGGVGKSTLVNKWLERMEADNYRGARKVFGWSFFSQGTNEQVTSADLFIFEALAWFDDPDPTLGSAWDRGRRLAELVKAEKALLILDGMEPLQSGDEFDRGEVRDPALAALLTELARDNAGLCVITSREQVRDLEPYADTVTRRDLEQISNEAGRALLRIDGVRGTDQELEAAVEAFGNHAFAVRLLAAYLSEIPGHSAAQALEIPDLDVPVEQGRHPRRLIEAFARRFGESPEVEVLRILGLFDRPADPEALTALRQPPAIPGYTSQVDAMNEGAWRDAIARLRRLRVVARENVHAPNELDAHPLVREHFAHPAVEALAAAWKEANSRLADHYLGATDEYPVNLERMMPLLRAVSHGCRAERHAEMFELSVDRIDRGHGFIVWECGAPTAALASFANFFADPFQSLNPSLTSHQNLMLLSSVGHCLQFVARFDESIQVRDFALRSARNLADWPNATDIVSGLSQVQMCKGDISGSVRSAELCMELAKLSGEERMLKIAYSSLGDTLFQMGRFSEAMECYEAGEVWSGAIFGVGEFFFLKSDLAGLSRCINGLSEMGSINGIISGTLSVLLGYTRDLNGASSESRAFFDSAVNIFRELGVLYFIPIGLLARAGHHRRYKRYDLAVGDLDEASRVAARGPMRLHQADILLESSRIQLTMGNVDSARTQLDEARQMIDEMGYHRRDGEVEDLKEALGVAES